MLDQSELSAVLTWDELREVANEAFNVWFGHPELRWAEEAWGILAAAGLTSYTTPLEYCRVCIRFFSLAAFYHDFCYHGFDEEVDPDYVWWANTLELHPFYIGQLVGADEDYSDTKGGPDLDFALRRLANAERDAVVKALLAHYEDEMFLFIALWRSVHYYDPKPDDDDVEAMAEWDEANSDILNVVTGGKLAVYSWLVDGAYPILPNW